jgi:site-specific DNA-methyltransferase (adenine-specific)
LRVIGEPIAIAPGSACTQSYLVAGNFDEASHARNFARYLTTKFARFLILQRKVSQDIVPGRFKFVPNLDMSREWSDPELFELFSLTPSEIAYIDKTIGERDWIDSLDSPIPATHIPGGRKFRPGDAPEELEEGDVE